MVKLLFLEGNIGSGKTTSLEYLQRRFEKVDPAQQPLFVLEPVEEWQHIPVTESAKSQPSTVNLLNSFYQNLPKYSFCFQTYAFLSRMKKLIETLKYAEEHGRNFIVCERSIFTDREIFLEALYETGSITIEERAVYHQLWNFWIGLMQPFFKDLEVHFLYVDCDPETGLEHIKIRDRVEEKDTVSLSYLKLLATKHQTLYAYPQQPTHQTTQQPTQSNKLHQLMQTLIGNQSVSKMQIHRIDNQKGLVSLYGQLDQLIENVLLEKKSFGLIDPRKIWGFWEFFWDQQ